MCISYPYSCIVLTWIQNGWHFVVIKASVLIINNNLHISTASKDSHRNKFIQRCSVKTNLIGREGQTPGRESDCYGHRNRLWCHTLIWTCSRRSGFLTCGKHLELFDSTIMSVAKCLSCCFQHICSILTAGYLRLSREPYGHWRKHAGYLPYPQHLHLVEVTVNLYQIRPTTSYLSYQEHWNIISQGMHK